MTDVECQELVPGDRVQVTSGMKVSCDMVITSGSVVVNEASLTGESMPVNKSQLPEKTQRVFNPDKDSGHVLFNGTNILHVMAEPEKEHVWASVIATGFLTTKGELIRSILFPRPTKFKFYRDSLRFILVLAGLSLIGFIYTIITFVYQQAPAEAMIKRGLDLVTIVIPPSLPIAMTIGTAFAVSRLKGYKIFTTSPTRVNVCGKVNKMVFDKTGTLTVDGLTVHGALAVTNAHFQDNVEQPSDMEGPLHYALACCHSLTIVNKEILGDALEIQMMQSAGWELEVAKSSVFVSSTQEKVCFTGNIVSYPRRAKLKSSKPLNSSQR